MAVQRNLSVQAPSLFRTGPADKAVSISDLEAIGRDHEVVRCVGCVEAVLVPWISGDIDCVGATVAVESLDKLIARLSRLDSDSVCHSGSVVAPLTDQVLGLRLLGRGCLLDSLSEDAYLEIRPEV